MGAKSQVNTKEPRPVNRCEECKRDFQTVPALKAHTLAKHPEKIKEIQTKTNETETKDEKKTAFVPPTSRVSRRLQQKNSTDTKDVDDEKSGIISAPMKRKTVFECPKCGQVFSVYFSAYKHIQKRHCEDKDGNPVSPNSSSLIRPILKEVKMEESEEKPPPLSSDSGTYCCLACHRTFQDVACFDQHVEDTHEDNVHRFHLSTMIEFVSWKSNVEAKQKVKYLSLSNTAQRQYYQCNYVSPQNSANMTHLCPAVMAVRELPRGVQVTYHHRHYEHPCEPVPIPTHQTHSMLSHNDQFHRSLKKGEDILGKLKYILKSVVERAAPLKKKQLKQLYVSALEMQDYLDNLPDSKNSIDESCKTDDSIPSDDDSRDNCEDVTSKSMTDDQITKALEAPRVSNRLKRKSVGSPVPEAKKKNIGTTQKTGLKENNSLSKDVNGVDRLCSPRPHVASPFSQSPSFNDSYRQFIEGTSPKTDKNGPKTEKEYIKSEKEAPPPKKVKKEIVKTKIGQFSPRKTAPLTVDSDNIENKKKVKAKKSNTSLENVNLEEVEYEVVEQENDCNILILKI